VANTGGQLYRGQSIHVKLMQRCITTTPWTRSRRPASRAVRIELFTDRVLCRACYRVSKCYRM